MSERDDVMVVAGARTPIGKYGGSLKDFPPTELGAIVVKEALSRSNVEPDEVDHVVFGNVLHSDAHDMYLSRVAAVKAGIPVDVPAFTLNRLCGSGLQAIVSAAQLVMLGDARVAVAGGAESMSRAPYWLNSMRWGQRMNDGRVIDVMVAALTDPFDDVHMGITAENVAKKWGISREDQDMLAVESHRRASEALANCYFKEQRVPVAVPVKGGTELFELDEHVRPDVDLASLAKLKPAFDANGTVTPGNASGINDAAAAVVLMSRRDAAERDVKPLGRLVAYAFAGVDPKYMGIGPVPAVKAVLAKAGLSIADMDVIELNEAFAAQALAVIRELDLPMDKTNPHGSGIALGHPIAATGCILSVKALYELKRISGRYALVTMCIGGGQGIAAIFERES